MSVITIDASQLVAGSKRFENMSKELADVVDDVLNTAVTEIATDAKQRASTQGLSGFGHLLIPAISANTSTYLSKQVNVGVFYAAYVEFGTGVYAAQYVGTLPPEWQKFASDFKGSGGKPSIKAILYFLTDWFRVKGIKDKQHAYFIARQIFLKGTKHHAFLYPAFAAHKGQLEKDLDAALKAFGR